MNIIKFVNSRNLTLNVEKTQAIVLGSSAYVNMFQSNDNSTLKIQNTAISYDNVVKNLGIFMDATLSWNDHCFYIINKVFSILAQLRRNFSYIPVQTRRMLVQTLIFPHFDYMLPLCTDLSQTNMIKLQRAQNACVRFICNVSKFQHITPFYKTVNFLKLEERRRLLLASMVWKIVKYGSPEYLGSQFIFSSNVKTKATRSHNCCKVKMINHLILLFR